MEAGIYDCVRCGRRTELTIPDREEIAHGSLVRIVCAHCDWMEIATDSRTRTGPLLAAKV